MNSKFIFRSILAVAVVTAASCKPELKTITPSKGSADFSRYIAVGNSLTSGFADGGLYLEGQQNAFPLMIGTQMQTVGGGTFSMPFFNANQADGSGYKKLTGFSATGDPVIVDVPAQAAIGTANVPGFGTVPLFTKYTGDLNNYGVPGIRLNNITLTYYGNLNPYFERLLPNTSPANTTSYLSFVTAKPFTFFSMWLGNNDVLGYATGGAAVAADFPTDKALFTQIYNGAVTALKTGGAGGTGAKGVVATIPDVLSTPYFTTVTLTAILAKVHLAAPTVNTIYIKTGAGTTRPATAQDYFLLPLSAANLIGTTTNAPYPYGLDPRNPVESKYVLDQAEAAVIVDYTNAYNATIKAVAASNGLALVDANALFKSYAGGKIVNGAAVSAAYITGNLFSLDGIHLTPFGYAIVANEFIKSINTQYGASIPTVDVTKYRGVKFP
ncbi:SGNH/GDSL hydrolase family protein [Pedobacter cryoconitis]|uniref:GDSL-like lipase/acylhydrolase family protein n=1 Tax=Pedobacter cryoconitis TaxID=188932 RepID=A0A327SY60_9SPHI|nr:SGNH/GDSL hydrolase family protein [Pedobacter cryoconitis]RAJ30447.1 GDSL-like lipase/acylhydrolase family protein [Pedobacter cryoconitis]